MSRVTGSNHKIQVPRRSTSGNVPARRGGERQQLASRLVLCPDTLQIMQLNNQAVISSP